MITVKLKICLVFCILLLPFSSSTNTWNTTTTTTVPLPIEIANTTTLVQPQNDDVILACGENGTDACHCWNDGRLYCSSLQNPLKSTNIKIMNKMFNLKNAKLNVNITILKKDKILPGNEHRIEILNFDFSEIRAIEDKAFDKFIKLSSLSLYYCGLSNISDGIFTKSLGKTLKSLNLERNALKTFDSNVFKHLRNLTYLNLGNNAIYPSICKELFPATLKELNLKFCEITTLDDDVFENLKNLTILILTGNPITSVPKAINLLLNLYSLKLDFTQISVLNNDEINEMKNMKEFVLTNTKTLESIDSCSFCSFPNLTKLDLSENRQLNFFHENAFGNLIGYNVSNLKEFKVNDCNLTVLPENLLPWENIKNIYASENPYICNCSMAWLFNDFVNPKPKYYKNFHGSIPRCAGPSKLEGQTFQEISGTKCFQTNSIIDNRIVVCDNEKRIQKSDDQIEEPCKCQNHEIYCNDYGFVTFLSFNVKIKDPKYILKNVSFSSFKNYSLKKGQIFHGHENTIEKFEIQYSKIEKIENGTFDDFTALKILALTNCYLNTINENILTQKLGQILIELNLEYSYFDNISITAFKYMKKLEKLSFNWNFETPLKKELFSKNLANLKTLNLQIFNHPFEDDIFENLLNLEELSLHGSSLKTIPTAINVLSNLQILDLSHSEIVNFANENLTTIFSKLSKLDISFSYLKTIEDCAFCLFPNLTEINLSYCKSLESIHENAFESLLNLKKLSLHGSSLKTIPTAINALSNLQILDLSYSEIVHFTNENLTTIFSNLSKLDISFSHSLKTIEDCAFCSFPNLIEIDLSNCINLVSIHENAFGNQKNDYGNETNITGLKKFNARRCKLSTISKDLLNWESTDFSFGWNPFVCNCSISWMINDFSNICPKYFKDSEAYYYYYERAYKCAGPPNLEGYSFNEISKKNCSTNFTTTAIFSKDPNCIISTPASKAYSNYYGTNSKTNNDGLIIALIIVVIFVVVGIIAAVIFYRRQKQKASPNVQSAMDKLNEDLTMTTL